MFIVAGGIFSCSMWTICWSLWDLVPDQEPNLGPLHWEWAVLATGPPGRSASLSLLNPSFSSLSCYLIFIALSIELRYVYQPSLYQLIYCRLSHCCCSPSSYPLLPNLLKKSIFLLLHLFISCFYTLISIYSLYCFSNCHRYSWIAMSC